MSIKGYKAEVKNEKLGDKLARIQDNIILLQAQHENAPELTKTKARQDLKSEVESYLAVVLAAMKAGKLKADPAGIAMQDPLPEFAPIVKELAVEIMTNLTPEAAQAATEVIQQQAKYGLVTKVKIGAYNGCMLVWDSVKGIVTYVVNGVKKFAVSLWNATKAFKDWIVWLFKKDQDIPESLMPCPAK